MVGGTSVSGLFWTETQDTAAFSARNFCKKLVSKKGQNFKIGQHSILKSLFFVASKTKNFLVSSNHLPVLLVACPLFACPRDDFSIPHHNINECFKMKTHRNPEKSQENLFFFVYKIKDRV
jgi:hypothetical protein